MALNVLHTPTRHAGFWGESTATLDWCEENYHHTPYIAEFWNTLSNLCFIIGGFGGAWQCYSARAAVPPRYAVLFVWMGVIGIGSLLFHATLKYSMQLLDEVPMLFSNSQMLYCLWHPSVGLRWLDCVPSWYRRSPLGHYAVAILITAIYVISPTPILFQICYGVMTLLVAVTLHLYANHLEAQHGPSISTVRRLLKRAAVFLIVAFAIWNVDNVWCDQLRSWRNERLPALLRPLLQLHAWWHVLTMISGTHSLVAVVVAWCRTDGRRVKLRWQMRAHCGGILPWIHFDLTASGEKSRIASHK